MRSGLTLDCKKYLATLSRQEAVKPIYAGASLSWN